MLKKYLLKLYESLSDIIVTSISFLAMFLAPIVELIIVALFLALLDMIIAIAASVKTKGIESFKSTKVSDTVTKIISYFSLIIVLHVVDVLFIKKLGFETLQLLVEDDNGLYNIWQKASLPALALFLIIFREFKSIDEKWKILFKWSFYETSIAYFQYFITKIKNMLPNGTK